MSYIYRKDECRVNLGVKGESKQFSNPRKTSRGNEKYSKTKRAGSVFTYAKLIRDSKLEMFLILIEHQMKIIEREISRLAVSVMLKNDDTKKSEFGVIEKLCIVNKQLKNLRIDLDRFNIYLVKKSEGEEYKRINPIEVERKKFMERGFVSNCLDELEENVRVFFVWLGHIYKSTKPSTENNQNVNYYEVLALYYPLKSLCEESLQKTEKLKEIFEGGNVNINIVEKRVFLQKIKSNYLTDIKKNIKKKERVQRERRSSLCIPQPSQSSKNTFSVVIKIKGQQTLLHPREQTPKKTKVVQNVLRRKTRKKSPKKKLFPSYILKHKIGNPNLLSAW